MGIVEILLISVGLAMDAFSVAVCKGLAMKKIDWKKAIIIAFYFGIFQALMPLIGFLLGNTFQDLITQIDHWVAFVLLGGIGINMIREAFLDEAESINDSIAVKTMILLSIATSIDALAVGITFAFLKTNFIALIILTIGVITFFMSLFGVIIGNKFGAKFGKKAEVLGGVILILIGIEVLCDHLIN